MGIEGHQPRMFFFPAGIDITPSRRLVCVSSNMNYGLQIFYWFDCLFVCLFSIITDLYLFYGDSQLRPMGNNLTKS